MKLLPKSLFAKVFLAFFFITTLAFFLLEGKAISIVKKQIKEEFCQRVKSELNLIKSNLIIGTKSYDYLDLYQNLSLFFSKEPDIVSLKIYQFSPSAPLIKLEKNYKNITFCKDEEFLEKPCLIDKKKEITISTLPITIEVTYSGKRLYANFKKIKNGLTQFGILLLSILTVLFIINTYLLRKEIGSFINAIKNWKKDKLTDLKNAVKSSEFLALADTFLEINKALKKEEKLDEAILEISTEIIKASLEAKSQYAFLTRVCEILKNKLNINYVRFINDPYIDAPLVKRGQDFLKLGRNKGVFIVYENEMLDPKLKEILSKIIDLALISVKEKTNKDRLFLSTITALANAIDATSPWTKGLSEKVSRLAVEIGEAMGLKDEVLEELKIGGLLHDIGKLGIPDHILNKPAKLTKEEYEIIKQHSVIGYRILKPIKELENILPIVLYHHERCNGTGYPEGLPCHKIPLPARITAVADVIEAMTAERPYKKSYSLEEVLKYLRENAGENKLFDPKVVKSAEAIKDRIQQILNSPLPI